MTARLIRPSRARGRVLGPSSGNYYSVDALGRAVVTDDTDITLLLSDGWVRDVLVGASSLALFTGKNADGSTIAAAASSGKFGISLTPGTSGVLSSEAAQNNTKTDKAYFEYVLPRDYQPGQNLTVTVNGKYAVSGGTAGTKTVDCEVWKIGTDGAHGSDICSTAAQTLTTSAADYAFTINGASLSPGDKIGIQLTAVIQETANGGTVTGSIASVRVQ